MACAAEGARGRSERRSAPDESEASHIGRRPLRRARGSPKKANTTILNNTKSVANKMSQFCRHPKLEPPHEAGGGRGSERGAGHAAICRKNYRPGLIKLFDRLEADTDGGRACSACMPAAWYYSSAAETAAAAAIQFSFRRRRHAHILHTTNDQGWGERERERELGVWVEISKNGGSNRFKIIQIIPGVTTTTAPCALPAAKEMARWAYLSRKGRAYDPP